MVMRDCIHHGACMFHCARGYQDISRLHERCNTDCDFYLPGCVGVRMAGGDTKLLTLILQEISAHGMELLAKSRDNEDKDDEPAGSDESEPAKREENFSECPFDPDDKPF